MTCQGLGRSNVTQEYATLSCRLPRSGWGQTPLPALCPVRPGPARGRENTVCFLTDCWACLASLSQGIARLALGRLREERGSPYPALHIRTLNGAWRHRCPQASVLSGTPRACQRLPSS